LHDVPAPSSTPFAFPMLRISTGLPPAGAPHREEGAPHFAGQDMSVRVIAAVMLVSFLVFVLGTLAGAAQIWAEFG
jgi:hypothetical protein